MKDGGRITGMRVRDAISGATFTVRAKVTINAAGSRAGEVMAMFGVSRPFPLLKAMNLVTSRPASDMALAAPVAGGRMLTLVPWRGRAIVGTSQSATVVEPGDTGVSSAEVMATDCRRQLRLPRAAAHRCRTSRSSTGASSRPPPARTVLLSSSPPQRSSIMPRTGPRAP